MASRKDTNYSCCSLCLDDGRNTVARHYCVDCETYFCTRCVTCHKLPSLKSHQVNDVNTSDVVEDDDTASLQSDVPDESVRKRRCTLHEDKLIDTFCKDHNEVCCGACAVVKHRSCTTVSIAIAAKDFKSSPELNELKVALTDNLVQSKQEKEKRTDNLDSIGKQKLELIENVDKYEEKIIARIRELANISRGEIRSLYEEHKAALDTDIESLDVVLATNSAFVDKLEEMDEEQMFVLIKIRKTVIQDGEMLLQAMAKDWKKRGIQLYFDQTLEKHAIEMKSLGRLDDYVDTEYKGECEVKEYQALFHSEVNVNKNDTDKAYVVDMCFTDENNLLLTDFQNSKLKRFDSLLQFKDEITLSGSLCAVCRTDAYEVAVRIKGTKTIHFVSIGQTMKLISSFTLADDGWGMTYDAGAGELLACGENQVSVYNKSGNKLRTYDKETNGEKMFSGCRQIALSLNKDIYVTDMMKGLVVLDNSGTLKMKVSLHSGTWPLCLLPGHVCLAGNVSPGVNVQVDKDGKLVGNLIDTTSGRTHVRTWSLVYDRAHSRLIVGGDSSVLFVYTLSAKYN